MPRLTRRDCERITMTMDALAVLGVTREEHDQLRRDSMRLQRWGEMECNYNVQRDETTGRVTVRNEYNHRWTIPDRETPALKRCKAIADAHGLVFYHQSDPRGAAVYIGKAEALGGQPVECAYTRLICVY